MAFSTTPYATLQDVKDALGYGPTNTASDAWITKVLVMAQATLDQEIGYKFQTDGTLVTPATRVYSGSDRSSMFIDECVSFATVTETTYSTFLGSGGGLWYGSSPSVVDITADIMLGPDNQNPAYMMFRVSGNTFVRARQNYKISGIFGYPSVPPDINYCCTMIAVHNIKKRDTNYADVLVEAAGSKQHYMKQLTPDIIEILEVYKHRTFVSR